MKKKLFFFTASFPFGVGENWKLNELDAFAKKFELVTIIPFSYSGNTVPINLPYNNVIVCKPIMTNNERLRNNIFTTFFNNRFYQYLQLFLKENAFFSVVRCINWATACFQANCTFKHYMVKQILNNEHENSIAYFFWGCESAYCIPFLPKNTFSHIHVRYNGYDLYEERQNGYIPFRHNQLKKINTAMPISENGKQYLIKKYPAFKHKIQKRIIGTKAIGNAIISTDNTLRIISCSNLIPLKRVEIIVAALMKINFDVHWIHIGGGQLQTVIETACKKLPPNIKWHITGKIAPNEVYNYYLNKQVDIFLNVSETEGLPVSIMEALSFGVPIFATNVGGTNELVNNNTGKLLAKDITPQALATDLLLFYNLPIAAKLQLRKNATTYFKTECDATLLANNLCSYFLQ